MNITIHAISGIYLGKIQYWNDPRIMKYNPNAKLPHQPIKSVARMDSATTTEFITRIFANNDPSWHNSFTSPEFIGGVCCNSMNWPYTHLFGNDVAGLWDL